MQVHGWDRSPRPTVEPAELGRHFRPENEIPKRSSSSFSLCRLLHCQQCSYVTRYHGQLKKHRRTHTGERPHRCSHCSKAFAQKNNLDDHLRLHTGDRPYQCHLCPRDFAQRTNLVTHLRTHTGEKAFRCRFCPEVFKYRYQREMHERNGAQARPGGEDSDSALV
ncbi:uncharacterized protein LOC144149557 isoform X4 [Haemaphysalis longicornis]